MLKLMRNEFQKIFCQKSTYVMLVLVLAITVGYQFLLNTVMNINYYWEPTREDVESDLTWYADMDGDDAIFYTAFYQAMLDYEAYDADYWGETQSWQGAALNTAYYYCYQVMNDLYVDGYTYSDEEKAKATELFDALIGCLDHNDYHAFCETMTNYYDSGYYYHEYYQAVLDYEMTEDDWRQDLLYNYIDAKLTVESYANLTEDDYDNTYYSALETYELIKYRFENNIEYCIMDGADGSSYYDDSVNYTFSSNYWYNIYYGSPMISLLSIMMIVVAGGIMANEFSGGTIKFLLVNPVKRGKIFFSKYFTLAVFTAVMSVIIFIVTLLAGLIFGREGLSAQYLIYSDGVISNGSVLSVVITPYLFALVSTCVTVTLAFMISSAMRSSAVSIGVSIAVLLVGSGVTSILASLEMDWGRFLVFANTDLNSIMNGNSLFAHHSLTFAVINIIVYMVVFLLTAYDGFTRREV